MITQIELYQLENWDGGGGTGNRASGFFVKTEEMAKEWQGNNMGTSYRLVKGIVVDSFDEMKDAVIELEKTKALAKLSPREKELLGLK